MISLSFRYFIITVILTIDKLKRIYYTLLVIEKVRWNMRRHRNRRKNKNKIIIITTVCLLFAITAGYAAFQTNLSITAKGNILEQDRVIQSWAANSNEDFHTSYYKANIVSATFLDNNNVPDNATESWNVSEDKEKGGVMAWVVPSTEANTKYDLYIGANGGVIANENSGYLFFNFRTLENINFNDNFDTSNATGMNSMFADCQSLLSLDLSNFNTENVTNMAGMFMSTATANPMNIETIILGKNFKTNKVTTMSAMFGNCTNLKNLDVSNFNTSNVINMHDMFSSCYNLPFLDLSKWDTSKVTDMHGMFYRCRSLNELNLCSFDTNKVTTMNLMFTETTNLTNIYVGPNWTTENATTTNMFTYSGVSEVTTGQC